MASTKRKAAAPAAKMKEPPTVEAQIEQLLAGLAQRGLVVNLGNVDVNNIRAHIQASAALNLLVSKGVCTQDEANTAINETIKTLLAGLLQAVEEAALRAAKSVQVAQKPPIQIARLRD